MLSEETKKALLDELKNDLLKEGWSAPDKQLGTPVLVTTEARGVFFGYADDYSSDPITLKNARNCIYWHKSVGGFAGLAVVGPNAQCKIGAQVGEIELRGITSVSQVDATAVLAWEKASCVS